MKGKRLLVRKSIIIILKKLKTGFIRAPEFQERLDVVRDLFNHGYLYLTKNLIQIGCIRD